jgi:uncharacterized membrane protein
MSAIAATGLAVVQGESRFLRMAIGSTAKGMLAILAVSILIGIFWPEQPLTAQLLGQVQPTILHLAVAVFAGLAGAYAMSHTEAAAALPGVAVSVSLEPPLAAAGIALATGHFGEAIGAGLNFAANLVAIIAAGVFVFLVTGFRPAAAQKERHALQRRTLPVAIALLVIIGLILGVVTVRLVRDARLTARVQEVATRELLAIAEADLVEVDIANLTQAEMPLELDITARSTHPIPYEHLLELQRQIGSALAGDLGRGREVALTLTVIRVTRLDPLVPPAPAIVANTATPSTRLASPSAAATASPSATAPATRRPTDTPRPSPTVERAIVAYKYGLNVRLEPDADSERLAYLPAGTKVVLLPGRETVSGIKWQQVEFRGVVGWLLADYIESGD